MKNRCFYKILYDNQNLGEVRPYIGKVNLIGAIPNLIFINGIILHKESVVSVEALFDELDEDGYI